MDYLAFDIETNKSPNFNLPEEGLQKELTTNNYFGVGVIYLSQSNQYVRFIESSVKAFVKWLLIEDNLLVGFNSKRFDLPVLKSYVDEDTWSLLRDRQHFDILEYFYEKINKQFRVSLENIAWETCKLRGVGNGKDMPRLIQEENYPPVFAHCSQDVLMTQKVFDYGRQYKHIRYSSKVDGKTRELEVDW